MSTDTTAPANTYQAAAWLRGRHPWLDELLPRVVGRPDGRQIEEWVDELVDGFNDLVETGSKWAEYESRNPAPADDDAYDQWRAAGPDYRTAAGRALAPMSSGEIRILRLITTLAFGQDSRCRAGWQVYDVDFDNRGAAIVEDWIAVVRAQLTALQHEQ